MPTSAQLDEFDGDLMAWSLFLRLRHNVNFSSSPYAINIGCLDGKDYNDPVYPFYKNGFSGVAIDAQEHPDLVRNIGSYPVTLLPNTYVTDANIVSLLRSAGCPQFPEFLKIDIDGVDADIVRSILLSGIRPLVIQAEINPEIPPPFAFSVVSNERFQPGGNWGFFGFSIQYGVHLMKQFGYHLVQIDMATAYTHDAMWVHESLVGLAGIETVDPRTEFLRFPPLIPHIATATQAAKESWRTRQDLSAVRAEIWLAMLEAGQRKHGTMECPFELFIDQSAAGRLPSAPTVLK